MSNWDFALALAAAAPEGLRSSCRIERDRRHDWYKDQALRFGASSMMTARERLRGQLPRFAVPE